MRFKLVVQERRVSNRSPTSDTHALLVYQGNTIACANDFDTREFLDDEIVE